VFTRAFYPGGRRHSLGISCVLRCSAELWLAHAWFSRPQAILEPSLGVGYGGLVAMSTKSRTWLATALVAGTLSACAGAPDRLINTADVVSFAKAPAGLGHKKAARALVNNYALLTRNAAAADLPRAEYLAAGIAPDATDVVANFQIYGYTRAQNSHAGDVFHTDYQIERVQRDGLDAALVTVVIGLTGVRPADLTRPDVSQAGTHRLRIERRPNGWVITGDAS
jgi:hypothetical protein